VLCREIELESVDTSAFAAAVGRDKLTNVGAS
jgi:hypothetical protein